MSMKKSKYQSVFQLFQHHVLQTPDQRALVQTDELGNTVAVLTYKQLADWIDCIACQLLDLGIQQGD